MAKSGTTQDFEESTSSRFISVEEFCDLSGLPVDVVLRQYAVDVHGQHLVPRFVADDFVNGASSPDYLDQDTTDRSDASDFLVSSLEDTVRDDEFNDSLELDLPVDTANADSSMKNSLSEPGLEPSRRDRLEDASPGDAFDRLEQRIRQSHNYWLAGPAQRLLARTLDVTLFSALLVLSLNYSRNWLGPIDALWLHPWFPVALAIFLVPLALVAEAFVWLMLGNTPGKFLMNITVSQRNGTNLRFPAYLRRNLFVWIRGLGLMIPPLTLLCLILRYREVSIEEPASYDAPYEIRVEADINGIGRNLLLFLAYLITAALCVYTYNLVGPDLVERFIPAVRDLETELPSLLQ